MASLNKVMLMGNLTRDPELRYTQSGMAVATLGLAVNEKRKDKEDEVLFVDCTVWGKTAENCVEYLSKGSPVFVEGKLKLNQWEQDGQKRSKIDVNAQSVQFLSSKGTKDSNAPQSEPDSEDLPF